MSAALVASHGIILVTMNLTWPRTPGTLGIWKEKRGRLKSGWPTNLGFSICWAMSGNGAKMFGTLIIRGRHRRVAELGMMVGSHKTVFCVAVLGSAAREGFARPFGVRARPITGTTMLDFALPEVLSLYFVG